MAESAAGAPTIRLVRMSLAIDDEEYRRLHATLSGDERDRVARSRPVVGRRFVACRGRVRCMLAGLLGLTPGAVVFRYGTHGKPAIDDQGGHGWRFNVSHSDDAAVVAIARCEVGVDLELAAGVARRETLATAAPAILADAERAAWLALPAGIRNDALLRTWVAKEALLKAVGLGVGGGMDRVVLPMPLDPPLPLALGNARTLTLERPGCAEPAILGPDVPGVTSIATAPGEHVAIACVARACVVQRMSCEEVVAGGAGYP